MAITGTFTADFSQFDAAVQKAVITLRGFEASTSKVETSLSKMTDSFSGRKIITEATLLGEVFSRFGGTSQLTAAELRRVSATAQEAAEKFRALGQEVPLNIQKLADLGTVAKGSQGILGDLSGKIVEVAAGFVSAQAIIGAVTGAYHQLSAFVGESVKAFAEAEAGDAKLVAALRQHAIATPAVIAQYTELGATFQRTTKYSDDQITAMQGLLTQVGGVMPSAMKGALQASTDLAAGLGIDLASATNLVAKAAAGHTETLGRYGITVSAAALESKGFDAVLEAVNRQFGGQAAAAIETYSGKVAQISNSWNNVQEAVGKFIVQNELATAALRALQEATADTDKATSGASTSFTTFASTLGGPQVGLAAAVLEGYVAHLNDIARLQRQIAGVPSPLAAWVKDFATLPPITAGMKLFNEEVATNARLLKDAGDRVKELTKADEEWARIDAAAVLASTKLWDEYNTLRVEHGGTANAIAIAQIDRWAADLTAQMVRAGTATTGFYEALAATSKEKMAGVGVDWNLFRTKSIPALQELADNAGKTYNTMLTSGQFFRPELEKQKQKWDDARDAARGYGQDGVAAQDALAAAAKRANEELLKQQKIAAALAAQNAAMGGSVQYDFSTVEGRAAVDPKIAFWLHQGYSLKQSSALAFSAAWQIPINQNDPMWTMVGPRVPGFKMGGPTGAGGLAVLHQDEYVVPKGGALVRGGNTASTVTVHMYVSGVMDPRTIGELSRGVNAELTRTLMQGGPLN